MKKGVASLLCAGLFLSFSGGCARWTDVEDLIYIPPEPAQGIVLDSFSQPVPFSKVRLIPHRGYSSSMSQTEDAFSWTNGQGQFEFKRVKPGSYRVEVTDSYGNKSEKAVSFTENGSRDIGILVVLNEGHLKGKVRFYDRRSIQGVKVVLKGTSFSEELEETGTFKFPRIPSKFYWITILDFHGTVLREEKVFVSVYGETDLGLMILYPDE